MQISITSNAPLVAQGFQDLSAELPKIGRRKIYDMINRITRKMEEYPAEREGQRYKRTGKLGFSWYVERLEAGYTIKNTARRKGVAYGKYVVGDARGSGQAWMHRGRWQKLRDVVDAEVEKLPQVVADEIKIVARKKGMNAT